jgi:hypothetical protein
MEKSEEDPARKEAEVEISCEEHFRARLRESAVRIVKSIDNNAPSALLGSMAGRLYECALAVCGEKDTHSLSKSRLESIRKRASFCPYCAKPMERGKEMCEACFQAFSNP